MVREIVPIQIPEDTELLVSFFISEEWPFHVNGTVTRESILENLSEGYFSSANAESFWIIDEDNKVGFLRIFDLEDVDDGYPLFDLRLAQRARGSGLGKFATKWLVKYLFEKYPNLDRIAGTTRNDNISMRKVFKATGFVKEGHYRKDWPGINGEIHDTVKYAILRDDWINGYVTPVHWKDE